MTVRTAECVANCEWIHAVRSHCSREDPGCLGMLPTTSAKHYVSMENTLWIVKFTCL